MRIIYAVTGCSEKVYTQLFSHVKLKPASTTQKYHRLLIEGLAAHTRVDVVANPPVNRSMVNKAWMRLPKEQVGNACYHHLPAVRNPILKLVCVAVGTFLKTFSLADRNTAVVFDCLNRTAALAALLAGRLCGCRCVGIITDLPDMFADSSESARRLANFVIRHCTDYVLLTEAMNDYVNKTSKPCVILEGHSDITMGKRHRHFVQSKPRVCLYAGSVSKQYGLEELVRGFQKANLTDTQLHIYGPGDYTEELTALAREDSRIYYGGMLFSSEVVEKEQKATLLVNPRPTHEEYVKYSFPSKTMEYMASGTPVLTTVLPGMPKEYYPYVYLLEDETADGIAEALKKIFAHSDEELFEKGKAAKEFILSTRNNVVQAGKILEMLEKCL